MGTILTYNVADSNVAIGKNMASNWESWEYNQEISDANGDSFLGSGGGGYGNHISFVTYGNTLVVRLNDYDKSNALIYEINGGTIELKKTISFAANPVWGNVAIYGDYIAIGDNLNSHVRIYKKTNGVWNTTPNQTITKSQVYNSSVYNFGDNLAISDKMLIVISSSSPP